MFISHLLVLAVVVGGSRGVPVAADEKPAPAVERLPDYARLTAEIRGTLQVEKDTVRVRVFLGGSCLVVFYDVWELDLGKDEELKKAAAKLNGSVVLVTGIPTRPIGGGMGFGGFDTKPQAQGQRVSVKTLTAAPAK